jgi:serine/threonine-protein kinase RsbW
VRVDISLTLPRDASTVPLVRRVCRDALAVLGVTPANISDIEIAVSEACTNVLKHVPGTSDVYEVRVEVGSRLCEITIIDTGRGFDHTIHGADDISLSLDAEGGRGIFLMQALVDRLEFRSVPRDGTIVHLSKALEFEDDSVFDKLALQTTS